MFRTIFLVDIGTSNQTAWVDPLRPRCVQACQSSHSSTCRNECRTKLHGNVKGRISCVPSGKAFVHVILTRQKTQRNVKEYEDLLTFDSRGFHANNDMFRSCQLEPTGTSTANPNLEKSQRLLIAIHCDSFHVISMSYNVLHSTPGGCGWTLVCLETCRSMAQFLLVAKLHQSDELLNVFFTRDNIRILSEYGRLLP